MPIASTAFTPIASTLGGVLIGLSAVALLYFNGRIAGISGIAGGALAPDSSADDRAWRGWFLAGLLAGALAWLALDPRAFGASPAGHSLARLAFAGVLVGVGTQLANGCTSGHGVCGLARLSPRSLVAVGTFMATAAAAVLLTGGAA